MWFILIGLAGLGLFALLANLCAGACQVLGKVLPTLIKAGTILAIVILIICAVCH